MLTQNFDQVPTVAEIPAPWTTSVAGSPGDTPWTLDTHSSQSAPVSAFTDAPDHVTEKVLLGPTFLYNASPNNAYVSFFQRYQLQSTFDGAVLEISINGGPFTDIITAGGSFTAGGYNGTINNTRSNPIGGRSAWTGNSPGYPSYFQTTANLPAAGAGQPVRLRWRVATDNATSSTGQSIDSITIVDDFPAMACTGAPAALPMEVGKILASPDKILWNFDAALSATSYVAMRGLTSGLPVGPGGGDETCSNLGASLQFQDVQVPLSGTSYWYLVKGKNACGAGSWGTRSNGTPHVTTSCP